MGDADYYEEGLDVDMEVRTLKKAIAKGRMTPHLKFALKEIVMALENEDWSRAGDVTAVKSYIIGGLKGQSCPNQQHHFCEDEKHNKKLIGSDLYRYLDGLHFEIAMKTKTIPSGAMIISKQGIQQRKFKKSSSPTVVLMDKEHMQIIREGEERQKRMERREREERELLAGQSMRVRKAYEKHGRK